MKLALCMIVKDEEEYLEQCIGSVRSIVDEIVVVDTGSKDKTIEIAKKRGAKVIEHEWKDDFSEARNVYLKHAKSDWILVLDADETIAEKDLQIIMKTIEEAPADKHFGVILPTRSYMNDSSSTKFKYSKDDDYSESKPYKGWDEYAMLRLFRNKPGLNYLGKVHESIKESIAGHGGEIIVKKIPIHHYGKLRSTVNSKSNLYEELGKQKADEQGDAKSFFELGIQQLVLGKNKEAIQNLQRSLDLNKSDIRCHINLGTAFIRTGEFDRSIDVMNKGIEVREHPDLYNNLMVAYENKGDASMALECFKKSIQLKESVEAYSNLVRICVKLGKHDDAIQLLRRVIELDPSDVTAHNNLGGLLLEKSEIDEAISILKKSAEKEEHPMTFENLAVAYTRKKDYPKAIGSFEKSLELGHPHPDEIRAEVERLRRL